MSQPTPYTRQYSFTNDQTNNPTTKTPGNQLDIEYNSILITLGEVLSNLALIQRDDGALANGSVGADQLTTELLTGVSPATFWTTATAYAAHATVFNGLLLYRCVTAHTSGTFAPDLAAGKWLQIADFTSMGGVSSIGGAAGTITMGAGLSMVGQALTSSAVASIASQGGVITMNGGAMSSADIPAPRYDVQQTLTSTQKSRARANIDALKKNYIVNGAMMVSQENGTTAGTTNGYYAVDQFVMSWSNAGTQTFQQIASVTPGGSPNRLRVTATVADASVGASDTLQIFQKIEGLRVADLRFGSSQAKTITVQFGVRAPAGTYCLSVSNGPDSRIYIAEYVIAAGEANTDVVKSVTIPGDTTGTWATDNTVGIGVHWGLMVGSTFQQAAGSWVTGPALSSPSQFNFMSTSTPPNNVFELFDVSLTEGPIAPAFQVPDYASELALCQRYWARVRIGVQNGTVTNTAAYGTGVTWPVRTRGTPTVAELTAVSGGNFAAGVTFNSTSDVGTLAYKFANLTGNASWLSECSVSARM